MIGYSKNGADELAKDFEALTGIDLNNESRDTPVMTARTLFYKVLKEKNLMNDRMISEWFLERGVAKGRSSITHALSKVGIYYTSYPEFRNIYNCYFNDKSKEFLTIEKRQKKVLKDVRLNLNKNVLNKKKDSLDLLIDSIEEGKRDEIRELVSLRVKSWSWKSKDECQVIQGGSSLQEYCF